MQFERLRKSHKKEIIIGAIAICVIGGALTFSLTKAKYKIANDLELAKGTVNYNQYDFKIMAMYKSDDKTNYTEITDRMPSSGYIINEAKSYCTLDNKNKDTNVKLYTNINGEHIIKSIAKNDKCYLYFDKYNFNASDIIIANLGNNLKNNDPDFSKIATNPENTDNNNGVFKAPDGMYGGTSYYWRGAATTNHVIFANKCWRIVRINGDGTFRLIYNGTVLENNTCHGNGENTDSIAVASQAYNYNYNQSEYVGWTYNIGSQRTLSGNASNAKSQTDTWYNNNIGNDTNYASKVVDGKFCNDRNTANGSNWSSQPTSTFHYATYERYYTNSTPTLGCPNGDIYTLKAGAITTDEVMMAGAHFVANKSFYLYNSVNYWTMSPYYMWSNGKSYKAVVCFVSVDGSVGNDDVNKASGIRPIVNLNSSITFSGGDGTQNYPYIVAD